MYLHHSLKGRCYGHSNIRRYFSRFKKSRDHQIIGKIFVRDFRKEKSSGTRVLSGNWIYTRRRMDRFASSKLHQLRDLVWKIRIQEANSEIKKSTLTRIEEGEDLPFRELVDVLTYWLVMASFLGQFNNCFSMEFWKAAKRVLRYSKGSCVVL